MLRCGCGPSPVVLAGVVLTLDLDLDRGDVRRDREPQGSSQCPPAYGEIETDRVGVQPGTSTGDAGPRVGDENALDHDDTHQVGSTTLVSAPDAGAHRGARIGTGDRATGRG